MLKKHVFGKCFRKKVTSFRLMDVLALDRMMMNKYKQKKASS